MVAESQVMVASHDHSLVALSVLISILAAYAARDLSVRIRDTRGGVSVAWLVGGATASGVCIWSMHFTAMQAFRLPVPVWYDWPTVLLSLFMGIVGAAAALFVLSRVKIAWPQLLAASIIYGGVGISGMHYTAMAAMRLQGMPHHSHSLIILSVLVAIVISFLALSLMFRFMDRGLDRDLGKHGSALLMGAANPAMHFVAMAGATFLYSDVPPDLSHALSITSPGALGIGIVPVMVLVVALLTSLVDRLQKQKALLDELFEQSPEAVALTGADNRIVRVNREFTRVFDYSPQEALGRLLTDLIVPQQLRDEEQKRYADMIANGERVDLEVTRHRKDGGRLLMSMVRVPVVVPGGRVEVYAIYRDISERKRDEEALRQSAERLQTLSRRLLEVQEEERRHLARKLHDEFGQILTAISLHLQAARRLAGDAARPRLDQCAAMLKQAGEQARSLALELHPAMLDTLGLEASLRRMAEQHQQRTGCEVHVGSHLSEKSLSPEITIVCFRMVQEALTNIARHAAARHVWIELTQSGNTLELIVRDDGMGFDVVPTQEQAARRGSLGMRGMRERVEVLGGTLQVESEPGHGTRIRASFPLSEPQS